MKPDCAAEVCLIFQVPVCVPHTKSTCLSVAKVEIYFTMGSPEAVLRVMPVIPHLSAVASSVRTSVCNLRRNIHLHPRSIGKERHFIDIVGGCIGTIFIGPVLYRIITKIRTIRYHLLVVHKVRCEGLVIAICIGIIAKYTKAGSSQITSSSLQASCCNLTSHTCTSSGSTCVDSETNRHLL